MQYESMGEAVARVAEQDPERVFIDEIDGGSISYGRFIVKVNEWASAYHALDIAAGDNVAIMYPNCIDAVMAWLGISWLGGCYVGVHNDYRGDALHYAIDQSDSTALVIAQQFLERIAPVANKLNKIKHVIVPNLDMPPPELPWPVLSLEDFLSGAKAHVKYDPPPGHALAGIVYTSGTTGMPKGVMAPFAMLDNRPVREGYDPDECHYNPLPLIHAGGMGQIITAGCAGVRVALKGRFSPNDFWNDICSYNCTFSVMVPAMAHWLMARSARDDDADNPLRSVQMAPVIPEAQEFSRRFDVEVRTGYGMSENGAPLMTPKGAVVTHRSGCGIAAADYEVRLVDDWDYDVPVGEVGELIVRSSVPWRLFTGYYNMPEATAEAWRNGWQHTGDLFRQDDDGNYHFVDRKKDALRRRGENISSFQVEAVMLKHKDVSEIAIIGVPSEIPGEQEIKAVAVIAGGSDLAPAALHNYCVENLPRFMVPRYLEFVDALPKTSATLRVQKVALRADWRTETTWDAETDGYLE